MILDDRLIIASAARFEAAPLLAHLDELKIPFTYIEVGIGAVCAALTAGGLRPLVLGRRVLFVGSAGYAGAVGEPYLVTACAVEWAPSDVRQGRGYLVPNAEPRIALDVLPSSSLRAVTVSCAGSITSIPEPGKETFENLELYSTVLAWQGFAEKFYSVLGVTNQLGPAAHAEWRKNFPKVADVTADFVIKYFNRD